MNNIIWIMIRCTVIGSLFLFPFPSVAQTFSSGLLLGYDGGTGFQANGMVSNIAKSFPFKARLSIGYISSDAGDPADARRIFINDATNGTPQEKGYRWDISMDFAYPVDILSLKRAYVYSGPRYSMFTANFKYVGGNEDFDVTCKQWGWGLGLENYFKMSSRLDLVAVGGFDYFFSDDLCGHDTSYSPDGTDVNGRADYDYQDANNAVNQPRFELVLMLGFNYYF